MADKTTICYSEVALAGVKPKIWRKLAIPGDFTLSEVHEILQIAMGWFNYHLHLFKLGDREYSDPTFELEDTFDEARLGLSGAFRKCPNGFQYVYDFGDTWTHDISLIERKSIAALDLPPRCVGGAKACPPEDCGGPWGYREFLDAVLDPKHEEHERMLEWACGPFDPESFNHRHVSAALIGWWQQQ